MPEVSVIIATYNRPGPLLEAVGSVLSQSVQNYEIIVVDDGSTIDMAACLTGLDDRLHYIRLEHCGKPGRVRNLGIRHAAGDYIAFLDDDDLWLPDKLELQLRLLADSPSLAMVYSNLMLLYADGSRSEPCLSEQQMRPASLFDQLLASCFIPLPTVVVRRQVLEQQGGFDEQLLTGEDYDLWLRLARTAQAGCVAQPLAIVRRLADSLSQSDELVSYRNASFVLLRALKTLNLTPAQRRVARRTLAHWEAHCGLLLLRAGKRREARRSFVCALQWYPGHRPAWLALLRSWLQRIDAWHGSF